jgi:hypothetical protein
VFDLEGLDFGFFLHYGHAHLMGDLADALDRVSGFLCTTHLHYNDVTRD